MVLGYARVYPECVCVYRVTHADVPGCTLCEAFASEDSEGACHVLELPLTLLVRVFDLGHARGLVAATGEHRHGGIALGRMGDGRGRDGLGRSRSYSDNGGHGDVQASL